MFITSEFEILVISGASSSEWAITGEPPIDRTAFADIFFALQSDFVNQTLRF